MALRLPLHLLLPLANSLHLLLPLANLLRLLLPLLPLSSLSLLLSLQLFSLLPLPFSELAF